LVEAPNKKLNTNMNLIKLFRGMFAMFKSKKDSAPTVQPTRTIIKVEKLPPAPPPPKNRILFILKKREISVEENNVLGSEIRPYFTYCVSSGLRNSATFMSDMLNDAGIESKLVEVTDNNDIDREVTKYKPTHVIIEAFWVVPSKFGILNKLHPKVIWIVRNHSEFPFMSNDGVAIEWTLNCLKYRNVFMAPNSENCYNDTIKIVTASLGPLVAKFKVLYLPNFYKIEQPSGAPKHVDGVTINIGCFGAVRPFKNHLVQAVAAIHYAKQHNKNLKFHINIARIEEAGNSALKNLRSLFAELDPKKYELVEHGWLEHKDFLKLVETMDLGLQVSFTESFNIVAADFVSMGVPIIVSKEIRWIPADFYANPTDSQDIYNVMEKTMYGYRFWKKANYALRGLIKVNSIAKKIWVDQFK
jgi:hypothetical protein